MRKPVIALAAVALAAVAAALAYASIPDSNGVIHGCYGPSGQLRVVDYPDHTCGPSQTPLDWNQTGPPGPPGPSGPSDAVSGFSPGVDIPDQFDTTIAELAIPEAGSYVVFAKFWVFNHDIHGGAVAVCKLVAGSDVDEVEAGTGGESTADVNAASAALNVVHTFSAAGTVQLKCGDAGAALGAEAIRITAIKVGQLTNGPLG